MVLRSFMLERHSAERAALLKEYREILMGLGPLAIAAQTDAKAAAEFSECVDTLVEAFATVLD